MTLQTASVQAFFFSRSGFLCHLNSQTATADERAQAREWIAGFAREVPEELVHLIVPIATNSVARDPGWGVGIVGTTGPINLDDAVVVPADRDSGYYIGILPMGIGEACGRQSVSGDWTFWLVGNDLWEVRYTAIEGDGYYDEAHVQEVFQHLPSWAYQLADIAGARAEAAADAADALAEDLDSIRGSL